MSSKEKEVEIAVEKSTETHELILLNDDVNTFDYVIDVLIRVCNHTPIQAEQCTLLTHFKGKCSVSSGSLEDMIALCLRLLDANLSAEVK
ncbi:MAG TPA: ATP-dependent Clp protease adaptor ClpS [Flavobacteriaceae bacterium]|nr:ATP-dependent Clp protease adaptor ClpS [Flavobacteriaceae bacterium]